MQRILFSMFVILAAVASPRPLAAGPVLESPQLGAVQLQQIDVLRFAPQGVLLIADGRGGQIVALDTGDMQPLAGTGAKVPNVAAEIAGRLGTKPADVEIIDLAVNPGGRWPTPLAFGLEADHSGSRQQYAAARRF